MSLHEGGYTTQQLRPYHILTFFLAGGILPLACHSLSSVLKLSLYNPSSVSILEALVNLHQEDGVLGHFSLREIAAPSPLQHRAHK